MLGKLKNNLTEKKWEVKVKQIHSLHKGEDEIYFEIFDTIVRTESIVATFGGLREELEELIKQDLESKI